MRYSYGSVDRRKILAYKPQLFQRSEDLLIFPGRDFHKWHNEILEFMDGIYQVNAKNLENRHVNTEDLDLVVALLVNIDNELMDIFNPTRRMDFNHHYVSIMDEKYKKRKPKLYGRDMYHIDRKVLRISPQVKHQHQMEILEYAHWLWAQKDKPTILKVKKR